MAKCGRYTLDKIIGQGTYNFLYLVEDNNNNFKALKVPINNDKYQEFGIESLLEIDIMRRLSHPNIISALELLSNTECPLISFGLILPLADYTMVDIINKPFINSIKKWKIMYKVAKAIDFLHQNNILHLDIKLANIVLQGPIDNIEPLLIDFNLSARVDDIIRGKDLHQEVFTVYYRPPEVFLGDYTYRGASDVWAYGILLIYTFIGSESRIYPNEILSQGDNTMGNYLFYIFSDRMRRKTLQDIFPNDMPNGLVDLSELILKTSYQERPRMADIISHPIFSSFANLNITGYVRDVEQTDTPLPDNFRDLLKLLIHWMRTGYSNYSIESLFLAIDILYRYGKNLHSANSVEKMTSAVTAIFMAIKLTTFTDHSVDFLVDQTKELTQGAVMGEMILNMENTIIRDFSGILYRPYLYAAAKNIAQLIIMFNEIMEPDNFRFYLTIDIPAWLSMLPSDGNSEKYMSINDFFKL